MNEECFFVSFIKKRKTYVMFKVNEIMVYPGYGVAKINREVIKEVNGIKLKFFELKFINKDITVLVPSEGIEGSGVREVSKEEDIIEIFELFCEAIKKEFIEEINLTSWNRRSKEYQNKIRNGKIKDISNIYKCLKYIEKKKILSFGEKAILSQVESLIAEEIMIIMKEENIELVIKELRKCCDMCLMGSGEKITNFLKIDIREKKIRI
jgi:CarD family transcriptional regulator